ncbi:MAG: hypothetical protein Q4615_00295 [Paracoccus aminovorans]|nr:hypothetical protein [Paracoccus aminovorans]
MTSSDRASAAHMRMLDLQAGHHRLVHGADGDLGRKEARCMFRRPPRRFSPSSQRVLKSGSRMSRASPASIWPGMASTASGVGSANIRFSA